MMPIRKRRRVQILALAAVALVGATAMIGYGMRDGIAFFRSPTELVAAPPPPQELFRIGGLVTEGSLVRDGARIAFTVTDGTSTVPVAYEGLLPDLFAEGQGVVAQGRWDGTSFQAVEILAKHDESYMPREVIDALKEQGTYVAPDAGS